PEVERLGGEGHEAEAWLRDALRFYVEFHRKHERLEGAVVNDVLAIAVLVQPDVLTFRDLRLTVDLAMGETRGRTRPDPKGALARVAMDVRPEPVRRLLFERVLPSLADAEAVAQ
ncbi:MAG: nucleoside hydrolase, partial [Gemmatimonadota bacterium]